MGKTQARGCTHATQRDISFENGRYRAYPLMVLASDEMPLLIAFPSVVNATTTPATTNAAATAYSDSSKPVSSRRNRLNIILAPLELSVINWSGGALLVPQELKARQPIHPGLASYRIGQSAEPGSYGVAQRPKCKYDSGNNQCGGYRVFRKLQACFITKETFNHPLAPFLEVRSFVFPSPSTTDNPIETELRVTEQLCSLNIDPVAYSIFQSGQERGHDSNTDQRRLHTRRAQACFVTKEVFHLISRLLFPLGHTRAKN